MKVAVLFSGAKDSTFAVYKAKQDGHEIMCLVTLLPDNPESYMFHHPNAEWTSLQAEMMGIPIMTRRTAGEKEKELEDLESVLREARSEYGIVGVVSGALASQYQKSRIDGICKRLGMESLAPLWGTDPEEHWNNILEAEFEVIITAVASDGLGKEWLGRKIDTKALQELKTLSQKHGFNLAGEGGEFETFVLNGPIFSRGLDIKKAETAWKGDCGICLIKELGIV